MKFDLISIGDCATDAFIRLSEAELNCQIDKPDCKICLKFASKIPYESVTEITAGGNSSNVAIGSARLGLATAFVSNVGADENGAETLAKLAKNKVDTAWVKQNTGLPTNYNYVLWYGNDRTILVKHENYESAWLINLFTPNEVGEPKTDWLYLSSLTDKDLSIHAQIANWLTAHPETKLAFSPGTLQLKVGVEKLKAIYARTEILFCNKQEALKIAPASEGSRTSRSQVRLPEQETSGSVRSTTSGSLEVGLLTSPVRTLAESIKQLGPKTVIITDSENGASVLDDQNNFYQLPASTLFGPAIERTGAGDAFASAYLTATINSLPADQALAWGALNSASVVTKIGPHDGLLTLAQIEEKLQL